MAFLGSKYARSGRLQCSATPLHGFKRATLLQRNGDRTASYERGGRRREGAGGRVARWLGFNGILSNQVAAKSCLRMLTFIRKASSMYKRLFMDRCEEESMGNG